MQESRINNLNADMQDNAASFIAESIISVIKVQGFCSVVLSGGNTPKVIYQKLSIGELSKKINWHKVYFFFGDERAVPFRSDLSNFQMADDNLFSKINIPETNIHRIRGELPDLANAATLYEEEISDFFVDKKNGKIEFDIMFLGLGSDGHTASLFPDTNSLNEQNKIVIAVPAPQIDPLVERISLTFKAINQSELIIFLVSGEEKKTVVTKVLNSKNPNPLFPATFVNKEKSIWFIS